MSPWGWSPERTQGIWRYGSLSIRPLVASAPWLTLGLLLLEFYFIGGSLVTAKGVVFDLPDTELGEGEVTGAVALIVPTARERLVFFDDARYVLGDPNSMSAFCEHLSDVIAKADNKHLLVLADRRTPGGELMTFAAVARKSGVEKVLFAEKRSDSEE